MPAISMLYAGCFGLLAMWVSFQAGSLRGKTGIPLGDGGDPDMLLAMRRHANFVEYVPLTLLIIALLEVNGVSTTAIHALAGSLLAFRFFHAIGLRGDTMQGVGRVVGAAGTALVLVVSSVWSIVAYF